MLGQKTRNSSQGMHQGKRCVRMPLRDHISLPCHKHRVCNRHKVASSSCGLGGSNVSCLQIREKTYQWEHLPQMSLQQRFSHAFAVWKKVWKKPPIFLLQPLLGTTNMHSF